MVGKTRLFNALMLGISFAAAPLSAGPVADKAAEVETLQAAGDSDAALLGASEILAQVWDSSPAIGIRETLLVAQPAAGYGIYNPRPDAKFKSGEPIYVYAEPYGFAYGSGGDGLYTIGFGVDLRVLSETGDVLGEMPNLADLNLTSRYQNREFQANLTYTLSGIPPGKYVLETTLHDKNSAKTGTFQTTIEIVQ